MPLLFWQGLALRVPLGYGPQILVLRLAKNWHRLFVFLFLQLDLFYRLETIRCIRDSMIAVVFPFGPTSLLRMDLSAIKGTLSVLVGILRTLSCMVILLAPIAAIEVFVGTLEMVICQYFLSSYATAVALRDLPLPNLLPALR